MHVNVRCIRKDNSISTQMILIWFLCFWFCADISTVSGYKSRSTIMVMSGRGYKGNSWYNLVVFVFCKLSAIWAQMETWQCWQFSETSGATSYGNSWRKGVISWCLEFDFLCVVSCQAARIYNFLFFNLSKFSMGLIWSHSVFLCHLISYVMFFVVVSSSWTLIFKPYSLFGSVPL